MEGNKSVRRPVYGAAIVAVLVVAVLAVVAVAALYGLGRGPSVGPGSTSSSSSQPAQPQSSRSTPAKVSLEEGALLPGWTTYVSQQYGFRIGYPLDWIVRPAERAWDIDTDAADPHSPGMDEFTSAAGAIRVTVFSLPVDPQVELTLDGSEYGLGHIETWIEAYCQKTGSSSCAGILDGAVRLCVEKHDCHPGLLVGVVPPFDREVQAFFTGGAYNSQLVVITLWATEDDSMLVPYGGGRRLIEGFLSSMCVTPFETRARFPCS